MYHREICACYFFQNILSVQNGENIFKDLHLQSYEMHYFP